MEITSPRSRSRAFTIINFIIGLIIAVILSTLLVLGLRIFIPPPEYPRYDTAGESCDGVDPSCYQRQQERYKKQQESYEKIQKDYSGQIFVVANIAGFILLVIGIMAFVLGLGTNIGAGIILAGGFGIVYGYTLGWYGADDSVKFIVGAVIAALVIAGGVIVNRMKHRTVTESQVPGV